MNKLATIYKIASHTTTLVQKRINLSNSFLSNHSNVIVLVTRDYAKSKDKRKESKVELISSIIGVELLPGKGVKVNIEIDENFLGEMINLDKLKTEMDKNLQNLNESFMKYVSVRTTSGSIESVPIVFEGKKYRLIELGQVARSPKFVSISMVTFPQAISATLKALSESGMNLNPQQEGTTIYVPVPKVTREYRDNLAKNAKSHFIKCRDGIRDVQNKCLKSLKMKSKTGEISEDDSHDVAEQVKVISDQFIMKAQKMLDEKQEELLGKKDES